MITKTLCVHNEEGLHARPAKDFSKLASSFSSCVTIEKDDMSFNAKSMLMVLSACVCCNDTFVLKTEGEDELAAMNALSEFIETLK